VRLVISGEALLKVYFEQWGPVISVKIRGVRTEAERPFAFVALTDLRHATLALGIRHPFKVKRCERRDGAASSESAPSAANNNDSNHSVNHLDTTDTPTGSAVDKLEDRTLWVGDLHKLSEAGDAVLVPLITLYFGRFGPLDPARPLAGAPGQWWRQAGQELHLCSLRARTLRRGGPLQCRGVQCAIEG